MEKISPETYDKYIKALMDISSAITSEQYLEDILKLIVLVTAKVTGVEICSLWLIDEKRKTSKDPSQGYASHRARIREGPVSDDE